MADHSTTTRNVKREKRSFTSDFANLMELLPWWSLLLVLSLQDLVIVWMLSSSWLLILIRECVEACGSLVPMFTRSSIPKFLRESSLLERKDETFVGTRVLSLAGSQSIVKTGYVVFFTLSLNLALFRLIVAINKRTVNVFFSLHRND